MNRSTHIWGIVPAAGVGSRMGADKPKQYLPLAGKTVLQVTLDKLQGLSALAGCVIALSDGDPYFGSICGTRAGLMTVPGGAERSQSVFHGLAYLMQRGCEQDWALVHDAARPCVRPANLQKLVQEVIHHNCGGLLAIPVADTLKRVEGDCVASTIDRSQLWQAHTPQMFRVSELYLALQVAASRKLAITDEASAMELAGYRPRIVADSRDNIKITQVDDLALAESILQSQQWR